MTSNPVSHCGLALPQGLASGADRALLSRDRPTLVPALVPRVAHGRIDLAHPRHDVVQGLGGGQAGRGLDAGRAIHFEQPHLAADRRRTSSGVGSGVAQLQRRGARAAQDGARARGAGSLCRNNNNNVPRPYHPP